MGFDESKHPRGGDGKFTDKGGGESSGSNASQATQGRQLNGTAYVPTSPVHFRERIAEAKDSNSPETRWRVCVHDAEDYKNDKLFLTERGSCVAIEPDGNIISVCKNQGDSSVRGKDLLKKAVENGGDRLDAFGGDLYDFYTRNGFEPVSWTPFNEEYAPDDWKQAKADGHNVKQEPVIFYKYTGQNVKESYDDFLNRIEANEDYDVAKGIRDKEMKK